MTFRPTGKLRPLDITGYFCPFYGDKPVPFEIGGSEALYVLLFERQPDLHSFLVPYPRVYNRVCVVEDGPQFIESLRGHVELAVNPTRQEDGNILFDQIVYQTASAWDRASAKPN